MSILTVRVGTPLQVILGQRTCRAKVFRAFPVIRVKEQPARLNRFHILTLSDWPLPDGDLVPSGTYVTFERTKYRIEDPKHLKALARAIELNAELLKVYVARVESELKVAGEAVDIEGLTEQQVYERQLKETSDEIARRKKHIEDLQIEIGHLDNSIERMQRVKDQLKRGKAGGNAAETKWFEKRLGDAQERIERSRGLRAKGSSGIEKERELLRQAVAERERIEAGSPTRASARRRALTRTKIRALTILSERLRSKLMSGDLLSADAMRTAYEETVAEPSGRRQER